MLPLKAVDRLFERLALTYGTQWDRVWEGRKIQDVKTVWADGLSGYASEGGLKCVAWALDNLPDRPPNLVQFRNLCFIAPRETVFEIPPPPANKEFVASVLAKVNPTVRDKSASFDHKGWAKRIIAREEAGEIMNPTTKRFSREALGMV